MNSCELGINFCVYVIKLMNKYLNGTVSETIV